MKHKIFCRERHDHCVDFLTHSEGDSNRNYPTIAISSLYYVCALLFSFQVIAFSYNDLMPEAQIFETPLVYGCLEGTRMCLIPPTRTMAHPYDDHELVGDYQWVNIAIANDAQFAGNISVLKAFNYIIVRNGSLFYCSNYINCNKGEINETLNVIAVVLEKGPGEDLCSSP